MLNLKKNKKNGFTLVEMLIVAPIVIGVIGAFIAMVVVMTGDILTTRGSNELSYNIQDALSRIEIDARMSAAYLAKNNVTVVSPQGYNNDNTEFHNVTLNNTTPPMLIFNSYTTTSNPVASTRNIVYKNSPNTCASEVTIQNPPLMMNVIYFVKDNTLWRRTIANSDYNTVGCSSTAASPVPFVPWQQPSCAPGISNAFCKTQDIKLVEGVSPTDGFLINYYTSINPETENTTTTDPVQSDANRLAALQTTKYAKITIKGSTTVAGRDISQSGSIIVTSQNTYTAN
jgi:type II secretory pathway pseudopilin PulG